MNKNDNQHPPKWSLKLLKWLIRPDFLEEIEGDMEEVFQDNLETMTVAKARRRYLKDVFQLIKPALVKNLTGEHKLNFYGMFRHSILLSLRIFKRYKSSFLINLTGLATGLASVLLIYLWVSDERAIDRFHEKGDRLYRVMGNTPTSQGINTWNGTSALLADALASEVPEIEFAIPGTDPGWEISFDLTYEGERFKTVGKYAGADYFQLFTNPLIIGNAREVLQAPDAAVISEQLAINMFGSAEEAIGKSINWQSLNIRGVLSISGVFETPAGKSTENFDMVHNFEGYTKDFGKGWQNPNSVTYVLLKEEASLDEVNQKLKNFLDNKVPENEKELFLANYGDGYLYGRYENGQVAGGRIEYIRLFSLIALFILAIACINFMNLSTARASRRIKEVGVKKAVGAGRGALIFQYLSESVLMSFISLLVGIFLVYLILPQFNVITGKAIKLDFSANLIAAGIGISLLTGLLAGSYPAFYLSGFNPALVLKGMLKGAVGELWVRRGLVIFQFTLAIVFIVGVVVVYKQMELVQNKQLGFEKDHVIYFEREGKSAEYDNLQGFLEGIQGIPGVEAASAINNHFFNPPGAGDFSWEGMPEDAPPFSRFMVYYNILETMDVTLIEGRDFSSEFPLIDEWQIIINEAAAKVIGFEDPVGKKTKFRGLDARIVGVVKDFHYQSLHENIGPAFFQLDPRFLLNAIVRIQPGSTRETLDRIEDYYQVYNPGFPLNYQFLDHNFQALYESEHKVASLSQYFAALAILISCLGLLGLVAFSAERRTKEIGIRKVLGSDKWSIVLMLSRDFTKLVSVAIFIGLPVSYYLSKSWLDGFAYPVVLHWSFFAGAGLSALLIAWAAVSFQTVRVAGMNPVKCLRDD